MTEHSPWDELAVGCALGALEPEDEETFRNHLHSCPQCAQTLSDMQAVSGQLAYGVPADEPPPALLESIMREVHASERVVTPLSRAASEPTRLRARRRAGDRPRSWETSWLTRAAVLLLVLGLAGWNYQLRADNEVKKKSIEVTNAVGRLMADPTATKVPLANQVKGNEGGLVIMKGGEAYLMVTNFARNDSENSIYVLWAQDKGSEAMYGVDKFKVVREGLNIIPVRKELANSAGIGVFAVSKETGSEIPATPSTAIAVGEVPKGTAT